MQLVPATDVPPDARPIRHGARAARLGAWALGTLAAGLGVGLIALAPRLADAPWALYLIGPPAVIVFAIVWLGLEAVLEHVRAAGRTSNCVAAFSDRGLFLGLRSYLNHHFPDDGPAFVFVPRESIRSWRPVRESAARPFESERAGARRAWIELELADVDTHDLAARLAAEATRDGPPRGLLGLTWYPRHRHAPVEVPRHSVVRVERVDAALERELDALGVVRADGDTPALTERAA